MKDDYDGFEYCSHIESVHQVVVRSKCNLSNLSVSYYANHCISCGTYFLDGKSFGGPKKMADYYVNKRARELLGQIPKNLELKAKDVHIEMRKDTKDSLEDF